MDRIFGPECLEKGGRLGVRDLNDHHDVGQISQFAPETAEGDGFTVPPAKSTIPTTPNVSEVDRLADQEGEKISGLKVVEGADEDVTFHRDI
ncbi:hypothetical protein [Brevundimonas sp.]|uniref:hypothetical protein n=1 Tax=Brevundimonas sp. TaxID=1871086 RepID=UPI0028A95433|nr:hypothetical protein [Brevundimonas sp.]